MISLFIYTVLSFISIYSVDKFYEKHYESHPIVGTWSYEFKNCVESYEYMPNGTRNSTSNQEIVKSLYIVTKKPLKSGYYELTDKIVEDNKKEDCSGSTADMTGDEVTLYFKFNDNMDKVTFCRNESSDNCFGPFKKK